MRIGVLRDPRMTSALTGASRPDQLTDLAGALNNLSFSKEELAEIEPVTHPTKSSEKP